MTDTRKRRLGAGFAAAALALTLVTACNSTDESRTPSEPEAPMTHEGHETTDESASPSATPGDEAPTITIANFTFETPDSVSPGETVSVVNEDDVEHSITSDVADLFDVTVAADSTGSLTAPDDPGSYSFHSTSYPEMTGVLTVE